MTRGAMYKERKDYIEKLAYLLTAFPEFGAIKYARTSKTEAEYIRVTDILGNSCFLDITGMPLHGVYKDVSNMIINGKAPESMICNKNTLMTIARYFM